MATETKRRQDLKSYFVKNAIPTEGNFADLIDAQLNQTDDGVFKRSGEPLSVVAAAGDQKRVLGLYSEYPAANVDWFISLKPAQDPKNAATVRPGFGVADGSGNTRLFIDSTTGSVGMGTNNPADKLHVSGGDLRVEGGDSRRIKVIADTSSVGVSLVARNAGTGRPYIDFTFGELDSAAGVRLSATSNSAATLAAKSGDVALTVTGSITATTTLSAAGITSTDTLTVTGMAMVKGGFSLNDGNIAAHINKDGALYRTGGQVYLTVDDLLYVRDIDGTTRFTFNTDSGSLKVTGNAAMMQMDGKDHCYIEFHPKGVGQGRKGWIGVGNANGSDIGIAADTGSVILNGTSGVFSASAFTAQAGLTTTTATASGLVKAYAGISVQDTNLSDHLNVDGAFYRYGGQVYLVVDDWLYVRNSGGTTTPIAFNTASGNLTLNGNLTAATATVNSKDVNSYLVPEGTIVMWSGTTNTIPSGWVLCDGRNVTKSGSTFTTPNLTNRFIRGTNGNPGGTGGADSVTLGVGNLPSHSHTFLDVSFSEHSGAMPSGMIAVSLPGNVGSKSTDWDNVGYARSATTDATGSSQGFSILPSYYSLCFIIFKPGWS